jgi:hypothetical protein
MMEKSNSYPLSQSELWAVEAQWTETKEWTPEGGLNGQPSRCRRDPHPLPTGARMMVREASGRTYVNLGGIAGVQLLSHGRDKELFFYFFFLKDSHDT